jgi:16S rRNA (cytosine1402-N4)-methyltransferase
MTADFPHEPVMLREVIDLVVVSKTGIYVDGTVGGAGHARAILDQTDAMLIGIDRDEEALAAAQSRLAEFGSRKILVKANFADLADVLAGLNIEKVDGVLLDLGVSSHQLDTAVRGFSFIQEARLDMRMDLSSDFSAFDIVNAYEQSDLEKIIRFYGEEKMAGRIARKIWEKRRLLPIETTSQLAAIVASAMPAKWRHQKIHPATRTFQAIRIAVNQELDCIKPAISAAVKVLKSGGRLGIISFHSLEDRIVKNEFRALTGICVCPKDIPYCVCQKETKVKIVTRKAIVPQAQEIENNPRARSAKLRVAEKA